MTQSQLTHLSDEEILSMKVKDLPLNEDSLPFKAQIKLFYKELAQRGIKWRPHIWPSEEWFSPDGVCGFAFPFTLLDPRLAKLEKKHVGFVEGATEKEFIKLIRHECGHAIDNAFHLRKKKSRQTAFGKSSLPYPNSYLPRPHSKAFVRHLPGSYAQAHPEEDWAETFAVWLGPKSEWRAKYRGWKALEKLELTNKILNSVKGKQPTRENRAEPLHFREDDRTVAEYFAWRKTALGLRRRNFFEKKLKGVFGRDASKPQASEFLKLYETELCREVARKSEIRAYVVKKMVVEFKRECKERRYRIKYSERRTKARIERILLTHSREYVQKKRHRIFM